MKLDKNLTPIWSRSYGSSKDDSGSCIVETEKGFVIAGKVGAVDGDVTQKPGGVFWRKCLGIYDRQRLREYNLG